MTDSFNPLAMDSLAESIVLRMMQNKPVPLDDLPKFTGAGVYAIYYTGDFPAYDIVRRHNENERWALPMYVGKAVPAGGRQGIDAPPTSNTAVWSRLTKDHAKSIRQASNLDIADFYAQWLIIDDIWIALGESALLRDLRPVWNAMVDGFGNHDPGSGRYKGLVPQWDTLHPGRPWANKLQARAASEADRIAADAAEYLRSRHGGTLPITVTIDEDHEANVTLPADQIPTGAED